MGDFRASRFYPDFFSCFLIEKFFFFGYNIIEMKKATKKFKMEINT